MIKITIPITDHNASFLTPEGEDNETSYYFVEYKLNEDKIYTSFQSFTDRIIINSVKEDAIYNVRITRYALKGGFVSNPLCFDVNTNMSGYTYVPV